MNRTYGVIGKFIPGFLLKKWNGRTRTHATSPASAASPPGHGTWCSPIVYHATMSVFMMLLFFFTHVPSPSPPLLRALHAAGRSAPKRR